MSDALPYEPLPFLEHLGVKVTERSPERVVVEVPAPLRADLQGLVQQLQGGLVATIIDVAGAILAGLMCDTTMVATADMSVHFLAPGRLGPIRAVATPLRRRKGGAVTEVRVLEAGNGDRLVATGVVSLAVLE